MQTKKFQKASKILSWFFKIYTGLILLILVLSLVTFLVSFFVQSSIYEDISFLTEEPPSFSLFFMDESIDGLEYARAILLAAPVSLGIMSYVSLQASRLFNRLFEGDSPFTYDFAGKVKNISYLLVIADVIDPIVNTLMVNLFTEMGSYFYLGLTNWTLFGLFLYIVSAVLNYGVSLQELSNETV